MSLVATVTTIGSSSIGSALLGGAASIGSALISGNAATSAANTIAGGANTATAQETALTQQAMQQNTAAEAPYTQAGEEALGQIMNVLGLPGGNQDINQAQQTQQNFNARAFMKANPDIAKNYAANAAALTKQGISEAQFAYQAWQNSGGNRAFTGNANYAGTQPTTAAAPGSTTSATGTAPGGFNPNNIPGYTYALNQADQTTENQAAAAGTGLSGNTLTALQANGEEYANNAYQQYLSNLGGIEKGGQTAAAATGLTNAQLLSSLGSEIGGNTTGAASAIAAGTVGAANAETGAIGNAYNTYTQQQTLAQLFGNNSSTVPAANPAGGIYVNPQWMQG